MRFIIDLPQRQVEQIQKLLDGGRYPNFTSFVQVAVDNQLLLESDSDAKELVQPQETMRDAVASMSAKSKGLLARPDRLVFLSHSVSKPTATVPLNVDALSAENVLGVVASEDAMLPGFISRLLPVKYAVRELHGRLVESGGSSLPLDDFLNAVGEEALQIGEWLARVDAHAKRRREEALAAGFPRKNRDAARSMDRYRNLFVANVRRSDQRVDGAAAFLKLVVLKRIENDNHIALTAAGSQFARLPNPVLDGELNAPLSLQEQKFFVNHIHRWVPGEFKAARILLQAISAGTIGRDALNERLSQAWPTSWSPEQVNSWRSGLMSRLAELRLLERVRKGRVLEYRVSPYGLKILDMAEDAS